MSYIFLFNYYLSIASISSSADIQAHQSDGHTILETFFNGVGQSSEFIIADE
jgi:hypothetical protein